MDFATVRQVLSAFMRLPFDDLNVNVVSPRTLYRMKRDTVRLKDKADAALLKERFGIEDP